MVLMRHFATSTAALAILLAAAFACSSSSEEEATPGDPDAAAVDDAGTAVLPPPSGSSPAGPAGSGLKTGLPCDVQAIIEDRCIACHAGTSPPPLLTYADLTAKSAVDPTKTLAQLSLERMKSATAPMPPPPAEKPAPEEIKVFEDWVAAGTPMGAVCTDPPPDGGTLDGGGDAGGDGGVKCTSGTTWNGGNNGSPLMRPGEACNACHQVMGGPNLRIAGTVYPTLHEPNSCNGSAPPPQLTVVITENSGRITRLPVNSAGNFFTRTRITAPYKAAVTDGTKTRSMVGSVTSGDCNSCHSVAGANGAPGRVMAP